MRFSCTSERMSESSVSVNLSPSQLATETLLNDMKALVNDHRSVASHLKLEITEGQVMANPEHSAYMLEALHSMGLGLALDDFGTGHSSLSHMRDFPVDLIKVDRSYTRQISEDEEIAALVAGVVHLACSLGLEVVAEGVETTRQFDLLRAMGCHFAQGHLLGKPVESARVHEYISQDMLRKSAA